MKMPFVLKTEKLSKPHWFAGLHESSMVGADIVLSGVIFNAFIFETKKDANKAMKNMAGFLPKEDWFISEIGGFEMSPDLEMAISEQAD